MSRKCSSSTCIFLFLLFGCWAVMLLGGCNNSSQGPIYVEVSPPLTAVGAGQTVQFTAIVTNDASAVTWSASSGTIDANGIFTAPSQSAVVTVTAVATKGGAKATATVNVVAPGQVAATANTQVATYTIAPAAAGNVSVQLGTDMNYGLTTWTQPVPTGGGPVSLFVAGMKASTLYHMRGVVQFADGSQYMDVDQTFTTGAAPVAQLPATTTTTTPGMTPQSGVEFLALVTANPALNTVAVTDLAGNVLWTYSPGTAIAAGAVAQPFKQLPNGHFLINFGITNSVGETLTNYTGL